MHCFQPHVSPIQQVSLGADDMVAAVEDGVVEVKAVEVESDAADA